MERALQLIQHENIEMVICPLPAPYLGYYQRGLHRRPLILINDSVEAGPRYLFRSVLWEELGHHYTLRPALVTGRWTLSAERTHVAIHEAKALRWAAQHILTDAEWFSVVEQPDQTIGALAAYWQVSLGLARLIVEYRYKGRIACTCPLCQHDEVP